MIISTHIILASLAIIILFFFFLRFLSRTSFLQIIVRCWRSFEDHFHVYQFYKVPQFNEHFQENQLHRKVSTYLSSLPAMEDSDFTNLFSGPKSNDILLRLDPNQVIEDRILGARVWWINQNSALLLKLRKKDKKRILRPYLQHILASVEEIEQRQKQIKLYMNLETGPQENGRWRWVPFTHPATMDTVVMDVELKNNIKADLESFLKSKQYYHRLGRVWKRSYLLYGGSGTGKSSFIAAMSRFLKYDVYEMDMTKVGDDGDLKKLLMQTTSRSMIVVEDLDRILMDRNTRNLGVSTRGVLNFMDGLISCCGEERIMVFTTNNKEKLVEDYQELMRPGRIDVHIEFKMCSNFTTFKSLAHCYLGVKEHKLFAQVEEMFQSEGGGGGGGSLSPAEIGEIMISNRNSPTRALKSVISALQNSNSKGGRLSKSSSSRSDIESDNGGVFCRESVHTIREFRKLYGIFKMGSRRKEESPLDNNFASADRERDSSKHGS